jgi:hypothetical protein
MHVVVILVLKKKFFFLNICALLGPIFFLYTGQTTILRPDDSKQLSHCEAL